MHKFLTICKNVIFILFFSIYLCISTKIFLTSKFYLVYIILLNGYFFDFINNYILVKSVRCFSFFLWKFIDKVMIDKVCINGLVNVIFLLSKIVRKLQTGYLYHYICFMMVGLFLLILSSLRILHAIF